MGTVQQNGAILGNHSVTSTIGKQVWRVRLVHAEPGARVVEASCEEGGQVLAMAFGEATTAEAAEDRARRRAAQLLLAAHPAPAASLAASLSDEADQSGAPADQPILPPAASPLRTGPGSPAPMGEPDGVGGQPTISPDPAPGPPRQPEPCPVPVEVPGPSPDPVSPPAASASHGGSEPDDWSEDLAMVEVQLERLGWDRNQESVYLERCLGHMERSSITRYQDLRLYIDALQTLSLPADPCTAPLPDPLPAAPAVPRAPDGAQQCSVAPVGLDHPAGPCLPGAPLWPQQPPIPER